MIRAVSLAALLLSVSFSNADEASAALKRAVGFFSTKVAVNGTYLWNYSEDLSKREGETAATATMARREKGCMKSSGVSRKMGTARPSRKR